ncbi:hypothetical protein M2124_001525 [Polynucleobacter sphagniphilus]|uniref:hypothetical protein n=1 Tax=Polynucleobacter sphagniphilus TaxID=1743169 RepID=UPI0024768101|nr:hypothetical protein [Polynucleobacter sphagniphilus]MDH6155242.1 hypothetical protein [Polynucleobacter sphagniphilus]
MNKVTEYSSKVNSLTLNTVENILEIGRLMLECKDTLEPDEYKLFLKETSYKEETPTVRKWNRIGDSYVRLKSISQHLPPVVSTLYKLSTLDSNKLNNLIDGQILTPTVTLKEIVDELNPPSTKTKPISIVLEMDSTIDEDTLQEILDSLDHYKKVIEVKMSQEVKNILNI